MPLRWLALLALLPIAAVAQEQEVTLRPGAGEATVVASCAGCHSLDYIPMNSWFLDTAAWTAEVGKMRHAFGAPVSDADAETIARYLADQYSPAARP